MCFPLAPDVTAYTPPQSTHFCNSSKERALYFSFYFGRIIISRNRLTLIDLQKPKQSGIPARKKIALHITSTTTLVGTQRINSTFNRHRMEVI